MYFIDSNSKYACITFEINLEELSLVQKMEKRIKNQVKPASLTSATTGRTINLKIVRFIRCYRRKDTENVENNESY